MYNTAIVPSTSLGPPVRRYRTDGDGVPVASAARGTVARIPTDAGHGPPDGITIDSDDNIWAVLAETGSVVCYSPMGEAKDKP